MATEEPNGDIQIGPLYIEALRRVEADCGPATCRRADPGYYAQRLSPPSCPEDEGARPPPRPLADPAVDGRHLAQALRTWGKLPVSLENVEGWEVVIRSQRAYVAAIDADDEDVERARAEAAGRQVESPYFTAEEAALYLRLPSVKALYNLVASVCGVGNRRRQIYKFTKEQLDKLLRRENPWG